MSKINYKEPFTIIEDNEFFDLLDEKVKQNQLTAQEISRCTGIARTTVERYFTRTCVPALYMKACVLRMIDEYLENRCDRCKRELKLCECYSNCPSEQHLISESNLCNC